VVLGTILLSAQGTVCRSRKVPPRSLSICWRIAESAMMHAGYAVPALLPDEVAVWRVLLRFCSTLLQTRE
jgi:hypothetical protein